MHILGARKKDKSVIIIDGFHLLLVVLLELDPMVPKVTSDSVLKGCS